MYHPVNYNYVQQRSWVTEEQRDIAKAKKHTAKNQRSSQPFLLRNHNSSFCHFQNTLWSSWFAVSPIIWNAVPIRLAGVASTTLRHFLQSFPRLTSRTSCTSSSTDLKESCIRELLEEEQVSASAAEAPAWEHCMLLDAAAPDANIVCKRRFSACKLTTTFSISSSLSSTSTLSASAFVIWPSPLV